MPGMSRRLSALAAGSLLVGTLAPAVPAAAEDLPEAPVQQPGPVPDTDRFIVKFKDGAVPGAARREAAYDQAAAVAGARADEKRTTATGAKVIETDRELGTGEAADLIGALEARPDVEYAEPDIRVQASVVPNDAFYSLQWGLSGQAAGMHLPAAWEKSTGAGTVVAVVDTGITAHPDLDANVLPGYDMISDAATARDGNGRDPDAADAGDTCSGERSSWHGTHVAGIVAAVGNNGRGVTGVAYGAKILPVRTLGACGGYLSDSSDAVIWAAGGSVPGIPANPHPADVINMSLGGAGSCPASMQRAIDFAVSAGAVVVAAAGNEQQPADSSAPANCRNVIAVAAAGPTGERAWYSNYGPGVDVTAPGGDSRYANGGIISTFNGGDAGPGEPGYAWLEGTSMAAPHVAGLAALMLASDPSLTPAAVEERMKETARPVSSCGTDCGAGLADAAAALSAGRPAQAPAIAPGQPVISGRTAVGSVLTAEPGTWSPAPDTLTYQWLRNGSAIPGATGPAYHPVPEDVGSSLAVQVTADKAGYLTAHAASAPTAPVGRGTLAAPAPRITGVAKVGGRLTAWKGAWTPGTAVKYQWLRNGRTIKGATAPTYRPGASDAGSRIQVRSTGSLAGYGTTSRTSAATAKTARGTLAAPQPKITGTVRAGSRLAAKAGNWTSGTALHYQWYRSGKAIKGAVRPTYRTVPADRGDRLQVKVTGTKAGYAAASRISEKTRKL